MFQLLVKGRVVKLHSRGSKSKGDDAVTVELAVRQWLQGDAVDSFFMVTLDKYWSDRLKKLDKLPMFLTFRCSALNITHENMISPDEYETVVWLKGEEWFL